MRPPRGCRRRTSRTSERTCTSWAPPTCPGPAWGCREISRTTRRTARPRAAPRPRRRTPSAWRRWCSRARATWSREACCRWVGSRCRTSRPEVRQILERSAQDITPTDGTSYAVSTGWDKWTGYGRLNAKAAVDMVSATTIPPEADMTAPDWYALVDGTVTVPFYANARWASTFGYTLEFAAGVEPTSFT